MNLFETSPPVFAAVKVFLRCFVFAMSVYFSSVPDSSDSDRQFARRICAGGQTEGHLFKLKRVYKLYFVLLVSVCPDVWVPVLAGVLAYFRC